LCNYLKLQTLRNGSNQFCIVANSGFEVDKIQLKSRLPQL